MSVLSSNSTSIFHKGCLLQGRSSLYSSRLLKADSTHVQLEAPSFSSFPFHDFCHSAYWSLHCNPLQDLYWVELLHMEIPVVITGNGVAVYNFFYVLVTFFPCFINIFPLFTLQGFSCFTKNSDLQGFPCIDYNFFMFQLQGFPCVIKFPCCCFSKNREIPVIKP